MAAVEAKMTTLVSRLLARTLEHKITWEPGATASYFQTSFPNFTVQVHRHEYRSDPDTFSLRLINDQSELMEEVYDSDIQRFSPLNLRSLHDLFFAARRAALGVDEALDSLLTALDEVDEAEAS